MRKINHLNPALFLAVLFLLMFPAGVFANVTKEEALSTAKAKVPSGCAVTEVSFNKKAGTWECEFLSKDKKKEYEVVVEAASGKVLKLEMEKVYDKGGKSVCITASKAKKAVLKRFKGVTVTRVRKAKDDGRYIFRVWFKSAAFHGDAEVNAKTGVVNEWRKFF